MINSEVSPPHQGAWTLEPTTTSIGFQANLFLGLKMKGHFARYESAITVGETTADGAIRVTVYTDSIATGIKLRDKHLRADNVFATERFSTMEFRSTAIAETPTGLDVAGTLRVRDVTKAISFRAISSTGSDLPRYNAEFTLDPKDFGISRPGTTKPVKVVLHATLRPV